MSTYKDLFLLLFETMSQAIEDLDGQNYGLATQRLAEAQARAYAATCRAAIAGAEGAAAADSAVNV